MKRLFQAYLLALGLSGLMLASEPVRARMELTVPQLYWALAWLSVWTVEGGWFWVLIAWIVYRFIQRKAASNMPAPLPPSSKRVS